MFINELKKEFEEISVLFVVSLEPSVLFQDILNKILSIYYFNVSLSIFLLYCQRASPDWGLTLYTLEQVFSVHLFEFGTYNVFFGATGTVTVLGFVARSKIFVSNIRTVAVLGIGICVRGAMTCNEQVWPCLIVLGSVASAIINQCQVQYHLIFLQQHSFDSRMPWVRILFGQREYKNSHY